MHRPPPIDPESGGDPHGQSWSGCLKDSGDDIRDSCVRVGPTSVWEPEKSPAEALGQATSRLPLSRCVNTLPPGFPAQRPEGPILGAASVHGILAGWRQQLQNGQVDAGQREESPVEVAEPVGQPG